MTVKNIIDQIEHIFGRQPEQQMLQLINDALTNMSGEIQHYTRVSKTDLVSYQRWYELDNKMIDIIKVEIKVTNDRYVKIPKLADPQNILRDDTDESGSSLT